MATWPELVVETARRTGRKRLRCEKDDFGDCYILGSRGHIQRKRTRNAGKADEQRHNPRLASRHSQEYRFCTNPAPWHLIALPDE